MFGLRVKFHGLYLEYFSFFHDVTRVGTVDANGRTIFVGDAHRDNGKRFVARADEKLIAFVE